MRAPNESLDDFINRSATRKPIPPPPVRFVYLTGEVEVLKPLATSYDFTKRKAAGTSLFNGFYGLSWFHRSLTVGGSLAVIALLIWTGILVGLYGPPPSSLVSPTELAIDQQPADMPAPREEPSSDLLSTWSRPTVSDEHHAVRSMVRSRAVRRPKARVFLAAYRHRHFTPLPQFVVSSFVPTTFIIYAENGQIKTRIEPWLTAAYKPPLPN
jgi:hypothetical protein